MLTRNYGHITTITARMTTLMNVHRFLPSGTRAQVLQGPRASKTWIYMSKGKKRKFLSAEITTVARLVYD